MDGEPCTAFGNDPNAPIEGPSERVLLWSRTERTGSWRGRKIRGGERRRLSDEKES